MSQRILCTELDSGSESNWISRHLLSRLEIEEHKEDAMEWKLYIGIEGRMFQPLGTIAATWTRNSVKSWQTDFFIAEAVVFDMIFGRHTRKCLCICGDGTCYRCAENGSVVQRYEAKH